MSFENKVEQKNHQNVFNYLKRIFFSNKNMVTKLGSKNIFFYRKKINIAQKKDKEKALFSENK